MKTIKGNLILRDDAHYEESIDVKGLIWCEGGFFDLKVDGDITARYIDVRILDAANINAVGIHALDVDAWDVVARDVYADHVVCEKVTLKEGGRVMAVSLTEDRLERERKVLKEVKE